MFTSHEKFILRSLIFVILGIAFAVTTSSTPNVIVWGDIIMGALFGTFLSFMWELFKSIVMC